MRPTLFWTGLILSLLAIPLAAYGIVNNMVSLKYTPEMGNWETHIRFWQIVLGIAAVGAIASAWVLIRRRRMAEQENESSS